MSSLDMIITATSCPKCGAYHYLRAWYTPSGYDDDGHAHEVELSELECPTCGYTPDEGDPEWDRVKELIYNVYTSPNITELGHIYQEIFGKNDIQQEIIEE